MLRKKNQYCIFSGLLYEFCKFFLHSLILNDTTLTNIDVFLNLHQNLSLVPSFLNLFLFFNTLKYNHLDIYKNVFANKESFAKLHQQKRIRI